MPSSEVFEFICMTCSKLKSLPRKDHEENKKAGSVIGYHCAECATEHLKTATEPLSNTGETHD